MVQEALRESLIYTSPQRQLDVAAEGISDSTLVEGRRGWQSASAMRSANSWVARQAPTGQVPTRLQALQTEVRPLLCGSEFFFCAVGAIEVQRID